ncbi:unnamed protein product [Mesocestoides corti]|uniref:Fibronectin type-III domain-containing protein n=1 Tax=Mesocestoides corti TaxID=53468 RepID=A0A3P6H0Z0_MESCO|nr:unnamed protein product [Mesocestoides corti]
MDEHERNFLSQRPELAEPHCLSKRSNCSLCLDVCRWSRQKTTTCESSCGALGLYFYLILQESVFKAFPNSPIEIHRQTCLDACTFSYASYIERASVVSGILSASCPLPSSWPEGSGCQHHRRCTTDADCSHTVIAKCCRADACHADGSLGIREHHSSSTLYRLAREGRPPALSRQTPPLGFCMQVTNDTVFAYRGVPPVPGRPTVRQTAMIPGEQEVYQLELDWPDYYNMSKSVDSPEWNSSAVFLVQVRLFRDLSGSLIGENGGLGDEILQEELFSEWRSLVWTTKVGAVLSDLSPGTWYQFRLKAASGAGFGGNGRPSRPVRVVTLPEAPRNLTETNSRIYSKKVEVKLHWESPIYRSVPIRFYRVSWKKNTLSQVDDSSLSEYEAKVPKTVLTYTLQDLEPGTVYKVQVTAVAVVDGKEWSSLPVTRFIKTIPLPSKGHSYGAQPQFYNSEGRSCQCGDSPENRNFIHPAFFEDGNLKTHLTIPRHFCKDNCVTIDSGHKRINDFCILVAQHFGESVKDTTIFHLLWYPHVCIETQNSKMGLPSTPTMVTVYTATLSSMNLEDLRFQCHYKLQLRIAEEPLPKVPKKSLELCFCTPSCTEVAVKSGPSPRNCSYADILIPHQPVDVGYQLFPTETIQRHPIKSGGVVSSSQSETKPVFSVHNSFKTGSSQQPGFDAIIFWKPHPEMIVSRVPGRYTKYADMAARSPIDARLQSRGYRVIWGPRLVEPIEPGMYSNGIAPQLDPERAESKVVDSKVYNVILRNLEPDTLYIVQVQTIGVHGDSPVNAVFFTTPSKSSHKDDLEWDWEFARAELSC